MSTDIQLYSSLFLIIIIIFLAIDDGEDLDINYLTGIYERIRADEFRPDNDHVTQVVKFEQTLVGKKPTLIAPHRRLVCYCRLYEIYDIAKREKLTAHQREVYLLNDLLVVS
jgi:IQ motif/SEC7 domain-containing protein